MKNILFIVHTGDASKIEFVKNLSLSLRKKEANVKIFLMSRGVKFLNGLKDFASVSLCSRNAQEFSIQEIPDVEFASQYRLSEMIQEADLILPII